MSRNPVGWFEIYVDDMARAKVFYEAVLGIELDRLPAPTNELEMWQFPADMNGHGTSGTLVKVDGMPAGGNSVLVYFSTDNCATEASRVADAGGELVRGKMSIGEYGFVALARDTEGNMFGLHSLS